MDEYAIAAIEAVQAPVDAYYVGTRLSVSEDAPSLDCAYKLQGRRKSPSVPLQNIRSYCAEQLDALPTMLRTLEHVTASPTKVSARQHALASRVDDTPH